MKRLFLCSTIKRVATNLSKKLGDQVSQPAVYITTSFMYKAQVGEEWQIQNRASLVAAGFNIVDYDITGKSAPEIEQDLSKYEIMYVEGGNTAYLLQQAQKNNFGTYIKERVTEGMIYISTSAGSVIAGPDISSADRPGKTAKDYGLTNTKGFGLIDFVVMPHWGDSEKREAYMEYKIPNAYHEDYPYLLLTDNQYVEVQDKWHHLIDVTKEK